MWHLRCVQNTLSRGARAPSGGVTREGVVVTDLQSLLDCHKNLSLSLSLSSHFLIVNKTSLEVFRRGERMGRVGFDSRIFSPWMAGHPRLTLRARSLSLQGERVGDRGGPATVWSLLCVAETRATRPNGE